MRIAVLAVAMAAGLVLGAAGPSQAAGFLSDLMSKLDILPDNAKALDGLNAAMGSPLDRAIARDAGRIDAEAYMKSIQAERAVRVPAAPTLINLSAGPSVCKTLVGACTVNVLATAGQACWCPTEDGGFATGTVGQ